VFFLRKIKENLYKINLSFLGFIKEIRRRNLKDYEAKQLLIHELNKAITLTVSSNFPQESIFSIETWPLKEKYEYLKVQMQLAGFKINVIPPPIISSCFTALVAYKKISKCRKIHKSAFYVISWTVKNAQKYLELNY